ncbi:MAG: T9SS type A sorting domain-containing protein [Saprospiraceae bacterium]
MKKILFLASALMLVGQLSAQSAYFTVKFPDDRTVQGCGLPPTTVQDWPVISQTAFCPFGVGVAVKDQVFYASGTSCGKILRRYRLLYWCDYDPNWSSYNIVLNPPNTDVGPTVTATPQNHGYLEYTQVIKFSDGGAPKFLDCPPMNTPVVFCDYSTNDPAQYHQNHIDQCEAVVNLKTRVTDACSKANIMLSYRIWLDLDGNGYPETYRSSSDALAWPIETTQTADTLTGQIKFPPGVGLPYGSHMIEWIAMDNCGNQSICKYPFKVKDCGPPTLFCHHGLSVNIMETGMIGLWATDFLQKTFDNCTPTDQIKVRIRKKGAGTGLPTTTNVLFDCDDLGIQPVEIWAVDAAGNATFCETFVDVQDPLDACNPFTGGGSDDRQKAATSDPKTTFFPAQPNPTDGLCALTFELSTGGEVALTLTDATGRLLETSRQFFGKGRHEIALDLARWQGTGLVLARLETAGGTATQKILVR